MAFFSRLEMDSLVGDWRRKPLNGGRSEAWYLFLGCKRLRLSPSARHDDGGRDASHE
jgi:hypothetical protein